MYTGLEHGEYIHHQLIQPPFFSFMMPNYIFVLIPAKTLVFLKQCYLKFALVA